MAKTQWFIGKLERPQETATPNEQILPNWLGRAFVHRQMGFWPSNRGSALLLLKVLRTYQALLGLQVFGHLAFQYIARVSPTRLHESPLMSASSLNRAGKAPPAFQADPRFRMASPSFFGLSTLRDLFIPSEYLVNFPDNIVPRYLYPSRHKT